MKDIFLGYPEIIGTVHGVNVPAPWFWEVGYSGKWESPEDVKKSVKQARTFPADSDNLGEFAYRTTVFSYADPYNPYINTLGYRVHIDNYKKLIGNGTKFFVPIVCSEFTVGKWGYPVGTAQKFPSALWEGQFPADLLEAFRNEQAKLLLYGFWEITYIDPEDLNSFCQRLNIPVNSVVVCSPNTEQKASYDSFFKKEQSCPKVIYCNAFADMPWVGNEVGCREKQRDRYYSELRDKVRPKKILNLNRRWSSERLYTVGYLKQKHEKDVLTSQGAIFCNGESTGQKALNDVKMYFGKDTECRKVVEKYYKAFPADKTVCHSPDLSDPINMENKTNYTQGVQDLAYVNLVTETSFPYNTGIFFTEKTYKPVWAFQPFLLLAAPHSLDRFKKLGFKTFDRWWNESYDEIEDYQDRLEAVMKVVDQVCAMSLGDLHKMCLDMEDVLVHNFNQYIYGYKDGYSRVLKELCDNWCE